jgi:hypothetical protein
MRSDFWFGLAVFIIGAIITCVTIVSLVLSYE